MIEIQNLSRCRAGQQILRDVTLRIRNGTEAGNFCALIGSAGAGKTTLLEMMAGCIRPDGGTVQIGGYDIVRQPREAKKQIGYLPQGMKPPADMTVWEYLDFVAGAKRLRGENAVRQIAAVCRQTAITDVQDKRIGALPDIVCRRVALAQTLLGKPEFLLLDDPAEGLDAAQSAPHCPIDVQKLDVDFLAFSGHKLMAPMGIGALYGKRALLDAMPPFLSGGEMIESVTRTGATYAQLPHKFEAGTVNAGGAVGLAAALDYLEQVGPDTVHARELALTRQAMEGMRAIPGVHILGSNDPADHCGIVSFTVDGVHPHDIAAILDRDQVCIRAGHHCAQPLLAHLGVRSSARASLAFYNTEEDVARLLDSVKDLRRKMGYGA